MDGEASSPTIQSAVTGEAQINPDIVLNHENEMVLRQACSMTNQLNHVVINIIV